MARLSCDRQAKDKSEFYALDSQKNGDKHAYMSTIPSPSPALPHTREQWQYWYGNMSATTLLRGFSLDYPTDISLRSKLALLGKQNSARITKIRHSGRNIC